MASVKEKKVKLLQELYKTVNDGLTREEFTAAFKLLTEYVKRVGEDNKRAMAELQLLKDKLTSDTGVELKKAQKMIDEQMNRAMKEQADSLNFMRDVVRKLRSGKDGKDGRDADNEYIIEQVLNNIPEPEPFKIPQEIYDELDRLREENKKQEEKIKELEKRPRGGGGGTSAVGVGSAMKFMVQNETPSGLINGSNTTYKVNRVINAVLSFGINGQLIHPSEYTVKGKTITMDSAIPAALSGTNFEITYV